VAGCSEISGFVRRARLDPLSDFRLVSDLLHGVRNGGAPLKRRSICTRLYGVTFL
jgi:hypothetical protein